MTFRVGQRVVCIATNEKAAAAYRINVPRVNEIYTIRNFEDRGTKPGLRLVEIVNTDNRAHQGGIICEPAFSCEWFRPLVERKTDISALTALLNPANHRSLENV